MIPTAFESPLRAAVKADDNVSISVCLNCGADIEEIDAAGLSLLQEAARLGNISALKNAYAATAVNKETPLFCLIVASLAKQIESIEVLKSFGARLMRRHYDVPFKCRGYGERFRSPRKLNQLGHDEL